MSIHRVPETVRVRYTIQDGEFEYGDSFVMRAPGDNPEETIYQELAGFYAYDQDERKEIVDGLTSEGFAMIGSRALKKVFIEAASEVTVIVRGGVIQDIQNIPEGTVIRVRDYDIENFTVQELEALPKDENGHSCMLYCWEHEP